jgi:hypothetical protein
MRPDALRMFWSFPRSSQRPQRKWTVSKKPALRFAEATAHFLQKVGTNGIEVLGKLD